MSESELALHASAQSVIMGAVSLVTKLQCERVTKTVDYTKGREGNLVLKTFQHELSEADRAEISTMIEHKILEDRPFEIYDIPDSLLPELGKLFPQHELAAHKSLRTARLVNLPEWNHTFLNCPFLYSTGNIGKIDIRSILHNPVKETIKIVYKLEPISSQLPIKLAEPHLVTLLTDLPQWAQGHAVESPTAGDDDQKVTPWSVSASTASGIDYDRLVLQFGCNVITPTLISQIEALTHRKAHYLLRRGIFFSHRDLHILLDAYQRGQKFYIYTGRGPSSESMHIGHIVPFLLTKALQEAFDVPLVVQMTDDEKFIFKDSIPLETVRRYCYENTKDIIALGFDLDKTLIFSNLEYIQYLYPLVLKIQAKLTANQIRGIFGFSDSDNVGKFAFPAVQAAPAFASAFPTIFGEKAKSVRCLIPQAIDQDPYFRMTRDIAPRLGLLKPAVIHSKFIPALQGAQTKMSGSDTASAIYLTDTPEEIHHKIMKYAFSGGGANIEEHRSKGANLEVDVAYQYLCCFLEDDAELARIGEQYKAGQMLTGEVKKILIKVLSDLVLEHQANRAKITESLLKSFMNPHRKTWEKFKTCDSSTNV